MPVKIIFRDKEYQVHAGIGLRECLAKIEINPESVLAVRNGQMITDDQLLQEGDVVKLVAVISGGVSR